MDPISIVGTLRGAIQVAEEIEKRLKDVDKLAEDDAKYYANYIEVAALAVEGLETKYLEILTYAQQLDLSDIKQRDDLRKRITDYIHREVFRPKLKFAIDRLEIGRKALEQRAKGLPIWSKVKDRKAALEKFDELIGQLRSYLGSLGGWEGPSAVALNDLQRVETALSGPQTDFAQLIDGLLMNLDKSDLFSYAGNCYRVIETLRLAFR